MITCQVLWKALEKKEFRVHSGTKDMYNGTVTSVQIHRSISVIKDFPITIGFTKDQFEAISSTLVFDVFTGHINEPVLQLQKLAFVLAYFVFKIAYTQNFTESV